jgi:hypothetical protein
VKAGSLDERFGNKILQMLSESRELGKIGVSRPKFITCEDVEEVVLSDLVSSSITDSMSVDEVSTEKGYGEEKKSIERTREEKKAPERTRERCRQAARRLAARGDILITQGGKTVDPSFAKGVMELRLVVE